MSPAPAMPSIDRGPHAQPLRANPAAHPIGRLAATAYEAGRDEALRLVELAGQEARADVAQQVAAARAATFAEGRCSAYEELLGELDEPVHAMHRDAGALAQALTRDSEDVSIGERIARAHKVTDGLERLIARFNALLAKAQAERTPTDRGASLGTSPLHHPDEQVRIVNSRLAGGIRPA